MPEIIASTYEIMHRLGSGGGGVVYLANHLRLNKQVVLKADKRKITTREDLLRREVDVLKDLRHPYIPQVYDFFVDGESVYTAMDYVDGESLDKALMRNERFTQAQVVRWAIQLLQALEYLHSPTHGSPPKGYVHSDIKPANIMRRMNGDICLIDFNISLALGEENVIGASAGYASPEHYGLDFSFSGSTVSNADETELIGGSIAGGGPQPQSSQSVTKRKTIVPDVRSDFYSVGATLYHLLSGRRPDKDATKVVPLSGEGISRQVADIVAKAMQPNPDLRYQTASEMLWDLEHLHENDRRTKRLKKQRRAVAALLAVLFLAGGVSAFAGLRYMERAQQAARVEAEHAAALEQEAKNALELIQSAQEALAAGDPIGAQKKALAALEKRTQYDAVAQYTLTDALGIYDLTEGFKADAMVVLPSEVIKQVLSPDGKYAAVLISGQVIVIELASGAFAAQLQANISASSDIAFVGTDTLIYAGPDGVCAYSIEKGVALWSTEEPAAEFAVARDGRSLAVLRSDGTGVTVYDGASGARKGTLSFDGLRRKSFHNDIFADAMDDIFALDDTGRWLAMSFENGALRLFDVTGRGGEAIDVFPESAYTSFEGGFYGGCFGCVAYDGTASDFFVLEPPDTVWITGSGTGQFRLNICEDGFCLAEDNVVARIDPDSMEQAELAFTQSGIRSFSHITGRTLVRGTDNKLLFFDGNAVLFDQHEDIPCDFADLSGPYAVVSGRDSSCVRILRLEDHDAQRIGTYDGKYSHKETHISRDRKTVLLYSASSEGLRVYGMDGTLLSEASFPDPDQIYNQRYLRTGESDLLEVTYYDGKRCFYSPADGSLLSQEIVEKPDKSLTERYETDRYIIEAPVHGAPVVLDKQSGAQVKTLETEDFLTNVTQVEGGIMTEYFNARGKRYGILLNEACESVAYLPDLYDVLPDGTLVFDDMRGNLRQSRIYSCQELMALANTD